MLFIQISETINVYSHVLFTRKHSHFVMIARSIVLIILKRFHFPFSKFQNENLSNLNFHVIFYNLIKKVKRVSLFVTYSWQHFSIFTLSDILIIWLANQRV